MRLTCPWFRLSLYVWASSGLVPEIDGETEGSELLIGVFVTPLVFEYTTARSVALHADPRDE